MAPGDVIGKWSPTLGHLAWNRVHRRLHTRSLASSRTRLGFEVTASPSFLLWRRRLRDACCVHVVGREPRRYSSTGRRLGRVFDASPASVWTVSNRARPTAFQPLVEKAGLARRSWEFATGVPGYGFLERGGVPGSLVRRFQARAGGLDFTRD